jgi:hypothetical protein
MNGYCTSLRAYFGTQFNPSDDTFDAIKVYRDGNVIRLGGPFRSEEEAEDCAGYHHALELTGVAA